MTAYVELYIDQGTTFNTLISLSDDITNSSLNIAGYTFVSQIRRSYYSANITANIVCAIANVNAGEITLSMDAGTTANIKAGRYVFDIKSTDAANTVTRVLEGIITVVPSVTR